MSNTTAPAAPSTLKASEVSDLDFVRIADLISHKWAEWEVSFTFEGKPCVGYLRGCPNHPTLFNEEKIENVEFDFWKIQKYKNTKNMRRQHRKIDKHIFLYTVCFATFIVAPYVVGYSLTTLYFMFQELY